MTRMLATVPAPSHFSFSARGKPKWAAASVIGASIAENATVRPKPKAKFSFTCEALLALLHAAGAALFGAMLAVVARLASRAVVRTGAGRCRGKSREAKETEDGDGSHTQRICDWHQ
jgi:hypothetical protein